MKDEHEWKAAGAVLGLVLLGGLAGCGSNGSTGSGNATAGSGVGGSGNGGGGGGGGGSGSGGGSGGGGGSGNGSGSATGSGGGSTTGSGGAGGSGGGSAIGTTLWARRFGEDPMGTRFVGSTLGVFPGGDVALGGNFTGALNLGAGPMDCSGGYSTGEGDLPDQVDDIFLARFDAAEGNTLWTKRFGDPSGAFLHRLVVDPLGNIIVGGEFSGDLDFGPGVMHGPEPSGDCGGRAMFLAKFDPDGNAVWSTDFNPSWPNQALWDIAVDATGAIVFGGDNSGIIDFGGGTLPWIADCFRNEFLVKLDAAGKHVFTVVLPVGEAPRIALDAAGDIFVARNEGFGAQQKLTISKRAAATGAEIWSKSFPTKSGLVTAVAVENGHAIVGGSFTESIDFGSGPVFPVSGYDVFLMKLDPTGNLVYAATADTSSISDIAVGPSGVFVGLNSDESSTPINTLTPIAGTNAFFVNNVRGIVAAPGSDLYVTGTFGGTLDFGTTQLTAVTTGDIFLGKMASP